VNIHILGLLSSDLGYSAPTIAALVGHKGRTMTVTLVAAQAQRGPLLG
jgi:hypothetical protein